MTNISLALKQFVFQGLSFYPFYVETILCVIIGIVMLRHRKLCHDSVSVQLIQIGVTTQFLCRENISVGSCCNNVSCIVSISVETRKVCRDRVLSPLNLISCCSFILMLRHSFLVLSMFSMATKFLCRDKTFCM